MQDILGARHVNFERRSPLISSKRGPQAIDNRATTDAVRGVSGPANSSSSLACRRNVIRNHDVRKRCCCRRRGCPCADKGQYSRRERLCHHRRRRCGGGGSSVAPGDIWHTCIRRGPAAMIIRQAARAFAILPTNGTQGPLHHRERSHRRRPVAVNGPTPPGPTPPGDARHVVNLRVSAVTALRRTVQVPLSIIDGHNACI